MTLHSVCFAPLLGLLLSLVIPQAAWAQPTYDESQVPTYQLPPLLGTEGQSAADWPQRREDLLRSFAQEVYGSLDADDLEVAFRPIEQDRQALGGAATRKQVALVFRRGSDSLRADLLLYLPNQVEGPVPVFLGLNFYGNHTIHFDSAITLTPHWVNNKPEFCITGHRVDHLSRGVRAYRWPVERILARGYGLATLYYGDLDPDYDDGFQNGLHGLMDGNPTPYSALSAWAYGLSRALDYLQSDPSVDGDRVAVLGHSRLGKAALWAGASDERFALVISNNSGCGGAALSRRRYGETLAAINQRFPHWFVPAFDRYNGREDQLPVDQHQLLALVAPRPLYVASAEQDRWADPKGEYLSLYHAGEAYRLLGYEGFASPEPPAVNEPRWAGRLGYHLRSGGHDILRYDWERYLDFADRQWR